MIKQIKLIIFLNRITISKKRFTLYIKTLIKNKL